MSRVGYLVADPKNLSPEESAGWKFISRQRTTVASRFSFHHITRNPKLLRGFSTLWWHYDSSVDLPSTTLHPEVVTTLRNYVERGGSLFLSLLAAQYVADLGFEEVRPNHTEKGQWGRTCWAEKYPDIRGMSSFQGHPIFDDLHGAAYTWSPQPKSTFSGAWYGEPSRPKSGRVVAVEREYIRLDEDWRVAVEYRIGKGRILTVGAFMFFADKENRFRPHLEVFARNCFNYLATGFRKATYWEFQPRAVRFVQRKPCAPIRSSMSRRWQPASSGLVLNREQATGNSFDVGGRRILIMGSERSGIEEVWVHPLRMLKDTRVGFKIGSRETVWADDLLPRIVVRPESVNREFRLHDTSIAETTFASQRFPCGAIRFDVQGEEHVEIIVTACIDLRTMWPLSDRATGPLSYAWDDGLQATVVNAETIHGVAILGGSLPPAEYIMGRYTEIKEQRGRFVGIPTEHAQVAVGLRYGVPPGTGCTIVLAGSPRSEREALGAYRRMMSHPLAQLNHHARYFTSLLSSTVEAKSVSQELETAHKWAVVATDRFFVETPGVGTSLMAGYATTRSGWNGGQQASGRPGYAWYFGRDSVWTALAMLAYGDFAKVRAVLEFLGRYQDITGKIAHEITTSGHVHYDAADATPLYILLMGKYLRESKDRRFCRQEFPRFQKAIEFCFSNDTDDDHLIENTNVGHGWIEGGPLFPAHAELYLNACWCAALDEAAYVAAKLGKAKVPGRWSREARRVRRIINDEYWNPSTGCYNFSRNADGTFNATSSVLPTVAIMLGIADRDKAERYMRVITSKTFASGWGMRMVANDDPMYNPEGYHNGSVWPLFTAWTGIAAIQCGLPDEGKQLIARNLLLFDKFALGCTPEVLHGERFELAGVCPHQAWSGALTILGTLAGQEKDQ